MDRVDNACLNAREAIDELIDQFEYGTERQTDELTFRCLVEFLLRHSFRRDLQGQVRFVTADLWICSDLYYMVILDINVVLRILRWNWIPSRSCCERTCGSRSNRTFLHQTSHSNKPDLPRQNFVHTSGSGISLVVVALLCFDSVSSFVAETAALARAMRPNASQVAFLAHSFFRGLMYLVKAIEGTVVAVVHN